MRGFGPRDKRLTHVRTDVAGCVRGIAARMLSAAQPGGELSWHYLLAPILEQNAVLSDLDRKRAITDIDPETGEAVQPFGLPACARGGARRSPSGSMKSAPLLSNRSRRMREQ